MPRTRRSLLATVLPAFFVLTGAQRDFADAGRMQRSIDRLLIRPEPFAPPRGLEKRVGIRLHRRGGWPVYTVTPRDREPARAAVYAHGGTWVHEISPFHWRLIARLAQATGTEFTVPIYPLAPLGTAAEVVAGFADITSDLVSRGGGRSVVLLGDSAGGTIALATAQMLRDRGVEPPRDVVLISPALDLSFSDPLIPRIQPTDPWLAVPGGRLAAQLWSGGLPIDDPVVSPIHGSLDGIGRLTVFTGTHDILNADAHALRRRARAEGHPLDFVQEANLLHVYPLIPIREGRIAADRIAEVLRGA